MSNNKYWHVVFLAFLSSFLPLQVYATDTPIDGSELSIHQVCRNSTAKITIELQNHTNKEIAFDFKRVSDGKVFGEEGVVGANEKFQTSLPSKAEGEKWIVHTLTQDYPITIKSLPICLPTPIAPPTFPSPPSPGKAELSIRQICRNDVSKITIELQNHTNKEIAFDFKRVSDGKVFGEEGAVSAHQTFQSPLPSKVEGEKWIVHTLNKDYQITIESLPKCLPTPTLPPKNPTTIPPENPTTTSPPLVITQVCRADRSTIALRIQNNSAQKIAFTFKRVSDGEVFGQEPGAVSGHKKVISPLPSTHLGEKWIVQTTKQDYPLTVKSLSGCQGGKLPQTANDGVTLIGWGGSMVVLGLGLLLYTRKVD